MVHSSADRYKKYRITLDSADAISGDAGNAVYNLQGVGLGGTIKKGAVYVSWFWSAADSAGGHDKFIAPNSGQMLKVKCNSFPLTDVQYKYSSGNKTINELDTTIAVMPNNRGESAGHQFAYYNEDLNMESRGHEFENWNPSQGLRIEITNIDDSAVTPADLTPYNMEITVIEYLEEVNAPGSKVNSVSNF